MFVEHVALQKIYSILATVNMMHLFTHAFKKITCTRFIMCFPVHKGYYGRRYSRLKERAPTRSRSRTIRHINVFHIVEQGSANADNIPLGHSQNKKEMRQSVLFLEQIKKERVDRLIYP